MIQLYYFLPLFKLSEARKYWTDIVQHSLQGVDWGLAVTQLVSDGGKHPRLRRLGEGLSDVVEHKAPRPVSALGRAHFKTPMADQCPLLVACALCSTIKLILKSAFYI